MINWEVAREVIENNLHSIQTKEGSYALSTEKCTDLAELIIEDLKNEAIKSSSPESTMAEGQQQGEGVKELVKQGLEIIDSYDYETGDPGDIIMRLESKLSQINILVK